MEFDLDKLAENIANSSCNKSAIGKLYFDASECQFIVKENGEPIPESASPLDCTISQTNID